MKKVKWTAHGRNQWKVYLSSEFSVDGFGKTIIVTVTNPTIKFFMQLNEEFEGPANQEAQTKRMMDMIEADPNFVSTEGPRKHRHKESLPQVWERKMHK